MDKEFFENKEGCGGQIVSREEVTKDLESKSPEEMEAEIKEMLDEVSSVTRFVKDRFIEITNKHQAISCTGALGFVAGVSFARKPVTFAGIGTNEALDNAFKVVMAGVMAHAD